MTDARALRERVARRICCVNGECCSPDRCHSWSFSREADAAIDLVLEEAARCAEEHWWMADIHWWMHATKKEVSAKSAQEIAAAIRAFKSGDAAPPQKAE